jgi:hypothetical protein
MIVRPAAAAAALLIGFLTGCVPHEDPAAPDDELHLESIEILNGADQTGHPGETLPDMVVGALKLSDGSYDQAHPVHVTMLSGNGWMFLPGVRAWGNGAVLPKAGTGRLGVYWELGASADEPQALRFWALGDDTIYADVYATSVPRDGG